MERDWGKDKQREREKERKKLKEKEKGEVIFQIFVNLSIEKIEGFDGGHRKKVKQKSFFWFRILNWKDYRKLLVIDFVL